MAVDEYSQDTVNRLRRLVASDSDLREQIDDQLAGLAKARSLVWRIYHLDYGFSAEDAAWDAGEALDELSAALVELLPAGPIDSSATDREGASV